MGGRGKLQTWAWGAVRAVLKDVARPNRVSNCVTSSNTCAKAEQTWVSAVVTATTGISTGASTTAAARLVVAPYDDDDDDEEEEKEEVGAEPEGTETEVEGREAGGGEMVGSGVVPPSMAERRVSRAVWARSKAEARNWLASCVERAGGGKEEAGKKTA